MTCGVDALMVEVVLDGRAAVTKMGPNSCLQRLVAKAALDVPLVLDGDVAHSNLHRTLHHSIEPIDFAMTVGLEPIPAQSAGISKVRGHPIWKNLSSFPKLLLEEDSKEFLKHRHKVGSSIVQTPSDTTWRNPLIDLG